MSDPYPKGGRDERFDFFRGIALIGIAINHIVPPAELMDRFGQFQLKTGLFFGFAEVFVFISGCVGGMAYFKWLGRHGFAYVQIKSGKRIGDILASNAVAATACLLVVSLFAFWGVQPEYFRAAAERPGTWYLGTVLLYQPMPFFNILGLYVALLLALPAYLWLYRRNCALALGAMFAVYLFSQAQFYLQGMRDPALPFFGSLLAWQFLFFLGVSIGVEVSRRRLPLRAHPLVIIAIAAYLLAGQFLEQARFAYFHFTDKHYLGIMRIADLLCAVYLIGLFIPRTLSHRAAFARAVVNLGQHALPMFCLSIVLSYLASFLLAAAAPQRALYLLGVLGVAGTLYAVGALFYRNRPERRTLVEASKQPQQDGDAPTNGTKRSAVAADGVFSKATAAPRVSGDQ